MFTHCFGYWNCNFDRQTFCIPCSRGLIVIHQIVHYPITWDVALLALSCFGCPFLIAQVFHAFKRNQQFIWILSFCLAAVCSFNSLNLNNPAYLNSKFDLHHYTFQVGIRITLLFAMLFCQLRHDFSCDLVDPCHSSIRPRLGCGCFLIGWICLQLQVRSRECHACSPPGEAFGEHVFFAMVSYGPVRQHLYSTYCHIPAFNSISYSNTFNTLVLFCAKIEGSGLRPVRPLLFGNWLLPPL